MRLRDEEIKIVDPGGVFAGLWVYDGVFLGLGLGLVSEDWVGW